MALWLDHNTLSATCEHSGEWMHGTAGRGWGGRTVHTPQDLATDVNALAKGIGDRAASAREKKNTTYLVNL